MFIHVFALTFCIWVFQNPSENSKVGISGGGLKGASSQGTNNLEGMPAVGQVWFPFVGSDICSPSSACHVCTSFPKISKLQSADSPLILTYCTSQENNPQFIFQHPSPVFLFTEISQWKGKVWFLRGGVVKLGSWEMWGGHLLNSSRRKSREMENWPVQDQHRELLSLLGLMINLHHSLPYGILNWTLIRIK